MSRLLPDTLRGRIVASSIVLFVLVTLPLVWVLVDSGNDRFDEQARTHFRDEVALAAASLGGLLEEGNVERLQVALDDLSRSSEFALAVYDESGALVASSQPQGNLPPAGFPPGELGEADRSDRVYKRGDDLFAVAEIAGADGWWLSATVESEMTSTSATLREQALVLFVAALAVFGLGLWLLVKRLTAPLLAIRDQAVETAQRGRPTEIEPAGPRLIRDLGGAFNSISEQLQQLERENADARRRLELIFEHLREGVLVVDSQEVVVAENPRAREILNNEQRPGLGLPFAVVVRDHDLVDLLRRSQRIMEPSSMPIDYARSGRSIEATVIPMQGERGTFSVVVLREVTEIRRLELVRREFVANVSHELRTPLASIRALADTLESGALEDQDVATDFLRRIIDEVDRLTALVEELLDLARLQSGRISLTRKPADPATVIRSGVERLKPQIERAGLSISLQLAEGLPAVSMDEARIEQVVINLLHNAIKFTPAGGTIEVVAQSVPGGIQVDIRDSGAGIPKEDLSRIFERFYKGDRSRQSEGSGLGLAISNHIIRAHQGEIWAQSAPGEGSTFSFSLPISASGSLVDGTRSQGASVSGSRSGD